MSDTNCPHCGEEYNCSSVADRSIFEKHKEACLSFDNADAIDDLRVRVEALEEESQKDGLDLFRMVFERVYKDSKKSEPAERAAESTRAAEDALRGFRAASGLTATLTATPSNPGVQVIGGKVVDYR